MGPQVSILMAQFGNLPRGTLVKYADIEAAVNEKRGTARLQGLIASWRKRMLREKAIVLQAQKGIGLEFLTAGGQMRHAVGRVRSAAKQAMKACYEAEVAPEAELTSQEKAARMHMLTRTASLAHELRTDRRISELQIGGAKKS